MSAIEIAWTVVGIIVGTGVGIGFGAIGLNPPEFRIARGCFWGSSLLLAGMDLVWYMQTGHSFLWRATRWGKEVDMASSFDPQSPKDTLILIGGSIENHSSTPSTTRNWKLDVTLPGDSKSRPTQLLPPRGTSLEAWRGMRIGEGKSTIYDWKNYLPELSATRPIILGNPPVGFVVFILRDVRTGQLRSGIRLVLSFDDAIGKTTRMDKILDKRLKTGPYIPGLPH